MDRDGAGHALQLDLAGWLADDSAAQRCDHSFGGEHLATLGLATQSSGEVHDGADRGVLEAPLEPDLDRKSVV